MSSKIFLTSGHIVAINAYEIALSQVGNASTTDSGYLIENTDYGCMIYANGWTGNVYFDRLGQGQHFFSVQKVDLSREMGTPIIVSVPFNLQAGEHLINLESFFVQNLANRDAIIYQLLGTAFSYHMAGMYIRKIAKYPLIKAIALDHTICLQYQTGDADLGQLELFYDWNTGFKKAVINGKRFVRSFSIDQLAHSEWYLSSVDEREAV